MGSVQSDYRCQICGGGVIEVYDTRKHTTDKQCHTCGFAMYEETELESDGKTYVLDENGKIKITKVNILNPCGAYYFKTGAGSKYRGIILRGSCGENLSEEEVIKKFTPDLNNELLPEGFNVDIDNSYITYRNSKTNEIKVIWGKGTPIKYE